MSIDKTALGPHLPDGWCWATVGDTGRYINGFAFKPEHREATGRPIVRIQNLTDPEKALNRTSLAVSDDFCVETGGMLVSWSATVDVFVWNREPALVNQHIFKVVPDENLVDRTFLFYWLKVAVDQLLDSEHLHGSTMKHINRGPFMAHRIPLPPLPEQQRIAEKLEELFSDLDSAEAELKAAQRKLTQHRRALLNAAIEGQLTADWRSTQQVLQEGGADLLARILSERRSRWEQQQLATFERQGKSPPKHWQRKYKEPASPDTAGLHELPAGWVWTSLDQLVSDASYGTSVKCNYESKGTPVLRIPNVRGGALDLQDMKFSTVDLKLDEGAHLAPGDVLVIRTNGSIGLVGRAAVVLTDLPAPHFFASYLLRLRSIETSCLHRWILAALTSDAGRKWLEARAVSSAGQHNISLSTLLTMPIPLPPLAEQSVALSELESWNEAILRQHAELDWSIKQSAAQRQTILRAAFAGQLVPQDTSDEPASVSLERARNGRVEREPQGNVRRSKRVKEPTMKTRRLADVLAGTGGWISAQEAFRLCGVSDGASTERIEELYAEIRNLDKAGRLAVEAVTDVEGRKIHDKIKLLAD